jgi:hypothetical protein
MNRQSVCYLGTVESNELLELTDAPIYVHPQIACILRGTVIFPLTDEWVDA